MVIWTMNGAQLRGLDLTDTATIQGNPWMQQENKTKHGEMIKHW